VIEEDQLERFPLAQGLSRDGVRADGEAAELSLRLLVDAGVDLVGKLRADDGAGRLEQQVQRPQGV